MKEAPQRWQDNAADGAFDVVFTFEERVFDIVIEGVSICRLYQRLLDVAAVFMMIGRWKVGMSALVTLHCALRGCGR